jgi:hypothetical protein
MLGNHPYICSKYINGYIKDVSLRNLDGNGIENVIYKVRNSFGQKALTHAGPKVYGVRKSIQGNFLFILFLFSKKS